MQAVVKLRARLVDELEVGLVDERGGVERVPGALAEELVMRHLPEFVVDGTPEALGGARFAALCRAEQERQIGGDHGRGGKREGRTTWAR